MGGGGLLGEAHGGGGGSGVGGDAEMEGKLVRINDRDYGCENREGWNLTYSMLVDKSSAMLVSGVSIVCTADST